MYITLSIISNSLCGWHHMLRNSFFNVQRLICDYLLALNFQICSFMHTYDHGFVLHKKLGKNGQQRFLNDFVPSSRMIETESAVTELGTHAVCVASNTRRVIATRDNGQRNC